MSPSSLFAKAVFIRAISIAKLIQPVRQLGVVSMLSTSQPRKSQLVLLADQKTAQTAAQENTPAARALSA